MGKQTPDCWSPAHSRKAANCSLVSMHGHEKATQCPASRSQAALCLPVCGFCLKLYWFAKCAPAQFRSVGQVTRPGHLSVSGSHSPPRPVAQFWDPSTVFLRGLWWARASFHGSNLLNYSPFSAFSILPVSPPGCLPLSSWNHLPTKQTGLTSLMLALFLGKPKLVKQ